MSRSGYVDDCDLDNNWEMIKWRGQVASATRGRRGQKMLTDLLSALDAMPEKSLIVHELETEDGEVCALGALGKARGIDMRKLDPDEPEEVAAAFGIAPQLAQEIVYINDERLDRVWDEAAKRYVNITPDQRWVRMRAWVARQIRPAV